MGHRYERNICVPSASSAEKNPRPLEERGTTKFTKATKTSHRRLANFVTCVTFVVNLLLLRMKVLGRESADLRRVHSLGKASVRPFVGRVAIPPRLRIVAAFLKS
jgi:hypothetical protein